MVVHRPPSKREQLEALLQQGSVFVHLDPRRPGVSVPSWLARRPQLVLQLGYNFPIPIPDLTIGADGVRCTLSFNRAPHACVVPWAAVYALVAQDGAMSVWSDDLPPEIIPPPEAERSMQVAPVPQRRTRGARGATAPSALPRARTAAARDRSADEIVTDVLRRKPTLAPEPTAPKGSGSNDSPLSEPTRLADHSARPSRPPGAPRRPSTAPRERPPYLRVVK